MKTAGTKQMAFSVPNLQARLVDLVAQGVGITAVQRDPHEPMIPESDPLAAGKPPALSIFIRAPFGTLIEILDRDRVPP